MNTINYFPIYVVIICFYLIASFVVTSGADCTRYVGQSAATVNSFNGLQCSIQYSVPTVYVNSSITFSGQLTVSGNSKIKIIGITPSAAFVSDGINRLFNVSNHATLSILSLKLWGNTLPNSITYGGMFYVTKATLQINSTIGFGGHADCGSFLHAVKSSISLANVNIHNSSSSSTASSCGGAFNVFNSTISMHSAVIQHNTGGDGGFMAADHSSIAIMGSLFNYNSATGDGGALYISQSSLYIQDTVFSNNHCGGNGGAVSITNSNNVSFNNVSYNSNIAQLDGGGLYVVSSSLQEINCRHTNSSAASGGAIFISGGSLVSIGSSITNHQAQIQGGGVNCDGSHVTFTAATIQYNTAVNSGGGIEAEYSCKLNILHSTLSHNSVVRGQTPISIGGSVSCQYASVTMNSTLITSSLAAQGGAFYGFYCSLILQHSEIFQSISSDGNIYADEGTSLVVYFSRFLNNTSSSTGSAILCFHASQCHVENSQFQNNTAHESGTLLVKFSNVVVGNCTFVGNIVDGVGGAIYVGEYSTGSISTSTFLANTASTYGGAIGIQISTNLQIYSSLFQANVAVSGGGIYVFSKANAIVTNSRFLQNVAHDSGGSIYVGDQSSFNCSGSRIVGSTSSEGGALYASYQSRTFLSHVFATDNSAGFTGKIV
jgi:predicted outer membrane repeat protein